MKQFINSIFLIVLIAFSNNLKADLSHIFDPFYSKGKTKGTDLGLAITHQIIKEHGGTSGEDTSFYIYLPA